MLEVFALMGGEGPHRQTLSNVAFFAALLSPCPLPSGAIILELREVSKSFGTVSVLAPITLSVACGRSTVLIGPSGCRKSTLLRLMLGLLR